MLDHPLPDVSHWVRYFSERELPVLRHTGKQLEVARARIDRVTSKDIIRIVLQDPLLAVRVLAHIQPMMRERRLSHDVTTIASAIMLLGIDAFFKRFEHLPLLEDQLKDAPQALLGALRVVRRSQQASRYAHEWAVWRMDNNVEEIALAALLHDLAEILLYTFAPRLALAIHDRQQRDPHLRSVAAQQEVLAGIVTQDIQFALCKAWRLPELLLALIDGEHTEHPRARNVILAVNLARHLAHGWRDPALPDDLQAIARLLNLSEAALGQRLGLAPPSESPAMHVPTFQINRSGP
ncbi:MAG: HDOD domain-containing protein [Zoogloeaceae bacterium]|jgi:HD-like signal output (HDOD) protein|nr:HDOD domain-containing protein [Zoogloeaceae bacterium]